LRRLWLNAALMMDAPEMRGRVSRNPGETQLLKKTIKEWKGLAVSLKYHL
jgi:hypothetical protein